MFNSKPFIFRPALNLSNLFTSCSLVTARSNTDDPTKSLFDHNATSSPVRSTIMVFTSVSVSKKNEHQTLYSTYM